MIILHGKCWEDAPRFDKQPNVNNPKCEFLHKWATSKRLTVCACVRGCADSMWQANSLCCDSNCEQLYWLVLMEAEISSRRTLVSDCQTHSFKPTLYTHIQVFMFYGEVFFYLIFIHQTQTHSHRVDWKGQIRGQKLKLITKLGDYTTVSTFFFNWTLLISFWGLSQQSLVLHVKKAFSESFKKW